MSTRHAFLVAAAGAVVLATGGCATGRIERALGDLDGGCCSCWNQVTSPNYPARSASDCLDAQAAPDEERCIDELAARRSRQASDEEIRQSHRACMADRGWVRDRWMLVVY
jgi:hypothetical protein